VTVWTDNKIKLVKKLVKRHKKKAIEELASECDLPVGSIHTILHEDLGLSKKAARWSLTFFLMSTKRSM
jgi:hypothetical protein